MLPVVTSIHDPTALAETCRQLSLHPPTRGSGRLGSQELSGWMIRLSGLCPILCDTLSGLVLYQPRDNAPHRYARLMRFIERYYDVRAQMSRQRTPRRERGGGSRRPQPRATAMNVFAL